MICVRVSYSKSRRLQADLAQTLYALLKMSPLKSKFSRLLNARVKIREILLKFRAGDTEGAGGGRKRGGGVWRSTFLRRKKQKGTPRKKKKTFKAETIKRLPPKSKCYCFNYSRAPTMVADNTQCSMAPPL